MKGMSKTELQEEIDQIIVDVGLPHKRNALTTALSGNFEYFDLFSLLLLACQFLHLKNVYIHHN